MDFLSGYRCLYGVLSVQEGHPVHTYCSGIVGFSGPQLMHRGPSMGNYQESSTESAVKEGRRLFDACHYYTHSPWYAAELFASTNVLMADGTTDGGCRNVPGVPQTDTR